MWLQVPGPLQLLEGVLFHVHSGEAREANPITDSRPIGMLDSGVGGLGIVREAIRLLPNEHFLYVGDTAHFPYGNRSVTEIWNSVRWIVRFLLQQDVKCILLACNTASSVVLPELRKDIPVPVIGVIEAGAREAVRTTKTGIVGVIGTRQTVASRAYDLAVQREAPEVKMISRAAPWLVEMVEAGVSGVALDEGIRLAVDPLIEAGIDALVLGCTHFLALHGQICATYPGLRVIDQAAETAKELKELLDNHDLHRTSAVADILGHDGSCTFWITGNDALHFQQVGATIMQQAISVPQRLNLSD